MSDQSQLEERYARQLAEAEIEGYVRQHRFCPPRRWRIDFAWVDVAFGVEIEGQPWGQRGSFARDLAAEAEKFATAQLIGWVILRVPEKWLRRPRDVEGEESEAIRWTRALLGQRVTPPMGEELMASAPTSAASALERSRS